MAKMEKSGQKKGKKRSKSGQKMQFLAEIKIGNWKTIPMR
jgi:hypothetical protein